MRQDFETEELYKFHVTNYGPNDFDDALFIKNAFINFATRLAAAQNAEEAVRYLDELHRVDLWIPMCTYYFKEECRRRECEIDVQRIKIIDSEAAYEEYLKRIVQ